MVIGESAYDVHRKRGFVLESADLLTCQENEGNQFSVPITETSFLPRPRTP